MSQTGVASTQVQRPIVPYYEVDGEVHMASSDVEAFLDCARYNEEGDAQLLKMYLDAHPEFINLADSQGRTAIHMAAANNHAQLLQLIMAYNPQANKVNQQGNTALHFAALNNAIEASRLLIRNKWSTSTRNAFGKTPLQLIQGKDYHQLQALLVQHDHSFDDDKNDNAVQNQQTASGSNTLLQQEQCNCNTSSNANIYSRQQSAQEDGTFDDKYKINNLSNDACVNRENQTTVSVQASDQNEEEAQHLSKSVNPNATKTLYFGSINMDEVE